MRIHIIQHVSFETPGSILAWAAKNNGVLSFSEMFNFRAFPALTDFDMLLVMGGPMGVNDEHIHPWLNGEKRFIRDSIAAGKKILGICLGAQLVAEALGSKVYPNQEKEIGWFPVHKANGANKKYAALPDSWTSFHWHGDTFDLPAGAEHLFFNETCRHQGFAYGNQILALQFHMEATETLVNAMTNHDDHELDSPGKVQSREDILAEKAHFETNRAYLETVLDIFSCNN